MNAAVLPDGATYAISRMAAGVDAVPLTQLAVQRPTARDFMLRHGTALIRLAVPVAHMMLIDIRWGLGAVRNDDDVWTAVEEMQPRAHRIFHLARDDDWAGRTRDLPAPAGRRPTDPDADLIIKKFEYFAVLLKSSPYAVESKTPPLERGERVPPFIRKIEGYIQLMPTLVLALRLNAVVPMMSDEARAICCRAADHAVDELISFALGIDGRTDPPLGMSLPGPMPVSKLFKDWERVLKIRRASDAIP